MGMGTLAGVGVAVAACLVVFAILIIMAFMSHRRSRRMRIAYLNQLKQQRPRETRESFVASCAERGLDASVAATVYDYVQGRCDIPGVPLLPTDPLDRVCDIVVHEEIDEILSAMGYQPLDENEWDILDWDAHALPPPSEPGAPIASLVQLVDTLEKRRVLGIGEPSIPAPE